MKHVFSFSEFLNENQSFRQDLENSFSKYLRGWRWDSNISGFTYSFQVGGVPVNAYLRHQDKAESISDTTLALEVGDDGRLVILTGDDRISNFFKKIMPRLLKSSAREADEILSNAGFKEE